MRRWERGAEGYVGEIGNRRDPGGVYDTVKGKGRKVESKSVIAVELKTG